MEDLDSGQNTTNCAEIIHQNGSQNQINLGKVMMRLNVNVVV